MWSPGTLLANKIYMKPTENLSKAFTFKIKRDAFNVRGSYPFLPFLNMVIIPGVVHSMEKTARESRRCYHQSVKQLGQR